MSFYIRRLKSATNFSLKTKEAHINGNIAFCTHLQPEVFRCLMIKAVQIFCRLL